MIQGAEGLLAVEKDSDYPDIARLYCRRTGSLPAGMAARYDSLDFGQPANQ